MKFFSNEKESDVEPQDDPDRTQHVSSGPVTVPPQRAGSPWSDAPRDPADETPASERDASPRDASDPEADVDLKQPAATTAYGPDGSVVEDTDHRSAPVADQDDRPRDDSPVDLPLTDDADGKSAIKDEGTFDSPKAVDPATGDALDRSDDVDGSRDSDPADRVDDSDRSDLSDRSDPSDRLDSEDFQRASESPAAPVAEAAAVPVAVAVPTPAAVPASATVPASSSGSGSASAAGSSSGAKLLPDGDSFAERFRDIQLRFVDEPKEATAEAATLVGDAVDTLTSALKAQRDGLAGNSDDTEKLRIELRAYREILNRLLAL